MNTKWILALLGGALLALVILGLVSRRHRVQEPVKVVRKLSSQPRRGYYVPPRDPGPPTSSKVAARAFSDATLKTTFKSYRTAVATGNDQLRDALRAGLSKNLSAVVSWAEADLAQARKPNDIAIARKTLESLRN